MRMLWLVSALLAVAGLAACGGGGSATARSAPPKPPEGPVDTFDTRLNSDGAGNELSLFPVLCCDGDRVYVAWYDRRNGALDIYFNRSLDGGVTWLAQDIRLDTDLPGAGNSLIPQICCSGANVYVVWYDLRGGEPDIRFNRSLDSGATWLASDIRLDTDVVGAAASLEPAICCSGSNVYVAWHDNRSGTWDVRANRSLDAGGTWLAADLRVDSNSNNQNAEYARLACAGTTVYCVWSDDRSGGSSVRFSRSLDGGATWAATDTLLNAGDAAGLPRLAADGPNVHVIWSDLRTGTSHLRYNVSTTSGADWRAADVQVDGGVGDAGNASLCASGAEMFVVWQDTRAGNADIYLQHTRDAGATWMLQDMRLDQDLAGVSTSWDPVIACDGAHLHVAWRDDRNGRFDILHSYSPDRGTTWSMPEIRVDTDGAGAAHSVGVQLCASGAEAVAVWYDERHGVGDIYANSISFTLP